MLHCFNHPQIPVSKTLFGDFNSHEKKMDLRSYNKADSHLPDGYYGMFTICADVGPGVATARKSILY
jgi:hypothetical protein